MPSTQNSTRDTILDTALALFVAQGYESTSLRQIADRLGFTKAALYYHFPAKDLLLIELTRPWLDAMSALVTMSQQQRDEPSTPPRREELMESYLDLLIAHHRTLRLLSQDASAVRHPDVGSRARALIGALNDALVGLDADDEERIRVACALGAVHAISTLDPAVLPVARTVVLRAALAALGAQAEVDDSA